MHEQLLSAANDYITLQGEGEGIFPTGVSGLNILKSCGSVMPFRQVYHPSLCIVLQGAKQIAFGEITLDYKEMECLLVGMGIPAIGAITDASKERPFIGITLDFDLLEMREVLSQMTEPPLAPSDQLCTQVLSVDENLAACMLRLLNTLALPDATRTLYAPIMREIYYWLLRGECGSLLSNMLLPSRQSQKIMKVVKYLKDNLNEKITVQQLAKTVQMSTSSFRQHFKEMIAMPPLQYQKHMRLLEARRLILSDAVNIGEAAFAVGYESASQFSREYSRLFGIAPKRDAINLKALQERYASRRLNG